MTSAIEIILCQILVDLENDIPEAKRSTEHFALRVRGTAELLRSDRQLKDFEYVHQCYKFDRDLEFDLVEKADLEKPYLRTVRAISQTIFLQ